MTVEPISEHEKVRPASNLLASNTLGQQIMQTQTCDVIHRFVCHLPHAQFAGSLQLANAGFQVEIGEQQGF